MFCVRREGTEAGSMSSIELLLSHESGLLGERMSIIGLHSQRANDNCFENVPYVFNFGKY